MNEKYIKFKEDLLNTGIFKKVRNEQYRVKDCPFCGDTKWHCYVKISQMDDTPVVYNCFKCNRFGMLREDFLEYYGIQLKIPFVKSKHSVSQSRILNVETVDARDRGFGNAVDYIASRVGVRPTIDEMKAFQYISNPIKYTGDYLTFNRVVNLNNRYWFKLTNGNIIGRWVDDNTDMRWLKLASVNIKSRGIYNIKLPFDLYQPIHVYIAEGIMDVIGLYYHYKQNQNVIYISTLGKSYEYGLDYLIDRGIFGKSVNVHIFKDNDVKTDSIYVSSIKAQLFNKIELYHNSTGHDFGCEHFTVEKCLDWKGRRNGRKNYEA